MNWVITREPAGYLPDRLELRPVSDRLLAVWREGPKASRILGVYATEQEARGVIELEELAHCLPFWVCAPISGDE